MVEWCNQTFSMLSILKEAEAEAVTANSLESLLLLIIKIQKQMSSKRLAQCCS
jgi:hypothetical protein